MPSMGETGRTDLERRDFLDMAEASRRAAAEYEGVPYWVNKHAGRTAYECPALWTT